MHAEPPLSSWSKRKFGDRAGEVRKIVAQSMLDAIISAQDAQDASGTARGYPFAFSLMPRKFEALREGFKDEPGVRIVRPHGSIHEMTVVSGNLIYPFRFAQDRSGNVMRASIAEDRVSGLVKVLFALFGAERTIEQLTLDVADKGESKRLTAVADSLSRLPEGTNLVLVAYACNHKAGLLELWWGESELLDDQGTLKWSHCEEIPLPKMAPTRDKRPQLADAERHAAQRFDQGPVPTPLLAPRPAVEQHNQDTFPPQSENVDLPSQNVADDEGS